MEIKNNKISYKSKYVSIPNGVLRDEYISIEARGLLALLMTHSETWRFNRTHIMRTCRCGDAKYNRMIKELKTSGYLQIEPSRDSKGRLKGYSWIIDPQPTVCGENRPSDKPPAEKPDPIRIPSNKNTNSKKPPNPQGDEKLAGDVFDLLWKFIKARTPDEFMGRHSKKKGRERFIKITERAVDPVPAGKMAHAICWFYTQDDQQRDGGRYIKGIVPVLNGELFDGFMAKGPYGSMAKKSTEELAEEKDADYWDFWVRRYRDQGDWSAPGPKPDEKGCLANKDVLKNNGYDVRNDSIND